jgi:hypothetical protein
MAVRVAIAVKQPQNGSMKQDTANNPDALLRVIQQVKENYLPPATTVGKRGKQRDFTALSFLLLAVAAVILRTYKESELHRLLSKDRRLLEAMGFVRLPHRTTIMRRLIGQRAEAEEQINALGLKILAEVKPEAELPQVSSIDGRMYEAQGPAWHKSDREEGVVPAGLRNVDTESAWSKSGYRGWVQGYRLVLQSLICPDPVPIFAAWKPNNENEAAIASDALKNELLKVTAVMLGDTSFNGKEFPQQYDEAGGWLLTPEQLPKERRSWKCDLYAYRKESIELLFQRIIQALGLKECPVKGLGRNGSLVLAGVWLYQVLFLSNYRNALPVAVVKDQIDEARWRIAA